MNDGGQFSNDKFSEKALPSNLFILQDDKGISLIDINKKSSTLICENLYGGPGMFIEKQSGKIFIHTNEMSEKKRNYLKIEAII